MILKENQALLVRLDERTSQLQHQIKELHDRLDEDREELKDDFVTKMEFKPVQRAVYAAIGFILTGFLGALVALVYKMPGVGH